MSAQAKPRSPTRIIDSHQHVYWHGHDDQGLIDDMDAHGIEYAWLLSWEIADTDPLAELYFRCLNPEHALPGGRHAGIPLSDLLRARARHPDRFLVGYCPHPTHPNAPQLLESAARVHDVRICGEWKFQMPFDDPRCLELFYAAGSLKLPVVLHLDIPYLPAKKGSPTYDPYWYGGTIDNLERALQTCPDTIFIGHAPGFWREISDDADRQSVAYPKGPVRGKGRLYNLFDTYPNLYADLSAGSARYALQRSRPHAERFLKRYSNRLLFGRDFYGADLHDFLKTLNLPRTARERIYHQNAERLVTPPT